MNQTTPPETSPDTAARPGGLAHQIATRIAAVAGVFSLAVCALLLYDYGRRQADDHLTSPDMFAWTRRRSRPAATRSWCGRGLS